MSEAAAANAPSSSRGRELLVLAVLLVAPFLLFANTLENGFHFDDQYRISANPEIETFWPPWRHFTDPRTGSTLRDLAQYRPLLPLTLSMDHAAAGTGWAQALGIDRLAMFHLTSIAIHALTTVLLWKLFRALLSAGPRRSIDARRNDSVALTAALLFCVHPIAGVPVNYLCARDLLLMNLFLVAALLVFVRGRGGGLRNGLAVGALLTLSILSKTNAIVAPALLIAIEVLVFGSSLRSKATWMRAVPAVVVSVGFLVGTHSLMGFSDSTNVVAPISKWTYSLNQLEGFVHYYLPATLWPYWLRILPDPGLNASLANVWVWLGLAFVVASLVLAWRWRECCPLVSLSIVAAWVLVSLTSSVIPLHNPLTDYRLTPSMPWVALAVAIAVHVRSTPKTGAIISGVLIAHFAIATVVVNRVWYDDESLWGHAVELGALPTAETNYAVAIQAENPERAREIHTRLMNAGTYELFAVYSRLHLGRLETQEGNHGEAIAILTKGIELYPGEAQMHSALGQAFYSAGRPVEALAASEQALAIDPRNQTYRWQAAGHAIHARQPERALEHLDELWEVAPDYADSRTLRAMARLLTGNREGAVEDYTVWIERNPDDVGARLNLGIALQQLGRCAEALPILEAIVGERPQAAKAIEACRNDGS